MINNFDVVIVGAGASGLMTAVAIRENNKLVRVAILDKNEKIGKKMYITGKGRCNITNCSDNQSVISNIVHNGKFLYSALNKFSPYDVMSFFENNGCPIVVERGNRVFPKSYKSSDVIKVFSNYISKNDIELFLSTNVKTISKDNDLFKILTNNNDVFMCKYLVVATGGYSYQSTGSTGDGYKFAKLFNHNVTPIKPALCGFKVDDIDELCDLTLKNIEVTISLNNKVKFKEFGDITFYKNLISGPLMLTASSLLNEFKNFEINVNLKPKVSENELKVRFFKLVDTCQKEKATTFMLNFMPMKLCKYISKRIGINLNDYVSTISKEKLNLLLQVMHKLTFVSPCLDDIKNGIVTAGGVDVALINPQSMQSKLIDNLFFVGEVLDLDAFTGGYNMQIAFTTGYNCGLYISNNIN